MVKFKIASRRTRFVDGRKRPTKNIAPNAHTKDYHRDTEFTEIYLLRALCVLW